jgi:hypothetical protein
LQDCEEIISLDTTIVKSILMKADALMMLRKAREGLKKSEEMRKEMITYET